MKKVDYVINGKQRKTGYCDELKLYLSGILVKKSIIVTVKLGIWGKPYESNFSIYIVRKIWGTVFYFTLSFICALELNMILRTNYINFSILPDS